MCHAQLGSICSCHGCKFIKCTLTTVALVFSGYSFLYFSLSWWVNRQYEYGGSQLQKSFSFLLKYESRVELLIIPIDPHCDLSLRHTQAKLLLLQESVTMATPSATQLRSGRDCHCVACRLQLVLCLVELRFPDVFCWLVCLCLSQCHHTGVFVWVHKQAPVHPSYPFEPDPWGQCYRKERQLSSELAPSECAVSFLLPLPSHHRIRAESLTHAASLYRY